MRLNTTLSTLLLVFCWILCLTTAFAQATFRWNSSSGTDWQVSGNWYYIVGSGTDDGNNGYPDGLDEALFDASSPIPSGALTNTPASVATVTLNGFTGTVQIGVQSGDNLTCGTLTINTGTLQINSGFDLTVTNTTTINGGTLTLNDPDPNSQHSLGVFALSNGTFNGPSSGSVQLTSATISGGTFNGNGGDYTIDQNQQLAILGGTFNAGSGNYSLSISSSDTVFDHTGGTFNHGTSTFSVSVEGSGTATLSTNTTTGFHNLTLTSNTSSGTKTVNFAGGGTFTIHNELERAVRLTNVTGTNLQYASGATLKYSNTVSNNNNVSGEWPSSSGPTNVIKQNTNTITLTADRTIPSGGVLELNSGGFTIGGTSSPTLTIALGAEARLTSGTLTINSGCTLTVNGALRRNGGSLTNNGTLTYGTTGTQTVDGNSYTGAVLWYSAGATIGAEFPASPSSVPNLLITTSGTVTGSASRTVRGIFRMTTGTLSLGSNTLTVLGDISGSAVAGIAAIANSTTLNLGGGSTSTLAQTISGNLTLNKLTINKQATGGPWASSNTVTVSAGASITFTANGTLTIQNGTLSFGSSSVLVATNLPTLTLNISSNGILKTGGQPLNTIPSQNFTVDGKIVFNGTSPETLPPDRTIARIEIDNSNNVQMSTGTVTVTDSLIFTLGNITQTDATSKVFVLASTCKVSGSGYVDGPVRRVFTGTGEGIVPTGRSTGSSPSANWITLNFSGGTGSATLRFEQINGDIGGPTSGIGWSARSTTRYWKIEVVSGSISSPYYGITVQKANSGISSPLGRILRSSAVPATPTSFESLVSPQTDNGTTVATPDNAYTNFQLAFTIVRDATGEQLIWGGGTSNDWNTNTNWRLPNGDVSSSVPTSTTNVIINGKRPGDVNTATENATVVISSPAVCQSLTVGDTTGIITSTLQIGSTLNVGSGSGYNPANTTFGQNSTIVWKDGSVGVQADAYQNLTVDNSSLLGTQGTGSITVSGNMVKQGSGTFTPASGNAITVSGNYTNLAGDANYSNASLTLNTDGTTFLLSGGTVSGTVTLAASTIQLNGGTMSANLTLNGSSTQTISGTTSLAGLTVTNTAEVNLNGQTRTVTGNVVLNNLTGTITNGTLRMAGTSAQTISGSGSGTVSNLTIDNSNGVTLNRPLELTGTLTMTNGNLNTTATNILTATATSGGSANSFVNGPLSISGNSYPKNYPIGKSTAYRPISINSSGSDSATIRAEMINMGATSSNLPPDLFKVSQVRYFSVDLISGSVSSPTITITYGPDDGVAGPPNGPSNLRVARSTDNNNWTNAGGTGIGSPSGSITSDPTTIAPITYFALGSFTPDNPLPVQLSSFTLTPRQRSIELVWQTESESENKGFIILRSESETGGYQEIASYLNTPALLGQGTTSSATRYRYVDSHNLQPGRAYWYKLVDIDFGGRRHEHQPMSVQTAFEYALDQNYPNPFNPSTAIQFSLEKSGKTVLEIYNTLGQKVATLVNGELSAGAHRYQWNASGLASGVYFYRLQSNEFVATKKMILVK
jgi:hypothetical protein